MITGSSKTPGNPLGVKTHGMSYSPTYKSWRAMRQRCGVVGGKPGTRYQALGISVCAAWQDSFEAFLADMGPRPEGTTLERKENTKGYEPGNCIWATAKEQQRNKSNNRVLTCGGVSKCISAWAEELGITPEAINARIKAGWSVEKAVTTGRLK